MADVAVGEVINKAVEIGANLIVQESSRLYWLEEDINWLEREMRHMRSYLENAEAKRVSEPKVADLVKDIRELALDVEDILDTFLPKIESHRSRGFLKRMANILNYCHTRSKFAREIEKIKRRVQAIEDDRNKYGIEDTNATNDDKLNSDPRVTALHYDDPIVIGFDKDIEKLKIKILDKSVDYLTISIVGMPGLGKTTLAKKVFKGVKDQFKSCAAISVSREPNVKNLVKNIAKQLGLDGEGENLEASIYAFLEGKSYVILLDDIWDTKTWDELKICFPIDSSLSRIIITSRDTGVGRYIGRTQSSLHQLQPFDFGTSWDLFCKLIMRSLGKKSSTQGFDESEELRETGIKIVERCGGLPLAIEVTVGILQERGLINASSWKEVLKGMGQDGKDKCSEILALSYKDLPGALKPCFLYLGVFPEDYEIRVAVLIRMWVGEKFIQGLGELEPEDVGEDYLNRLVRRNLVQVVDRNFDGRIRRIRVHDLLHSLCVNVAKEINFFNTTLDLHLEKNVVNRVRRLSFYENKNISLDSSMRKLRSLIVLEPQMGNQIQNLSYFRLLRVLRLVLCDSGCPVEVGDMNNLSYFQLVELEVKVPSSICNIRNLQTLDLQYCVFLTLPTGIWKMKQLRHLLLPLLLSECSFYDKENASYKSLMPDHEVSLPNLQTLSSRCFFTQMELPNLRKLKWAFNKDEDLELVNGVEPMATKKLETLHLLTDTNLSKWKLDLSQKNNILKLKLVGSLKVLPQPHQFPPNLLRLTLLGTLLKRDPIEVLKKLPHLKILKLRFCSYLGRELDLSGVGIFPRLEILHLIDLQKLEELIRREAGALPKLRQVVVENCNRLVTVPLSFQTLMASNTENRLPQLRLVDQLDPIRAFF